jgi:hypothetical protein
MNNREARTIAQSILRQTYLENFEQLQLICLKLNIEIDFDYVYFYKEQLPIAAVYGISIDEKNLYILTKNNQLHCISLLNREHSIFDLNKSKFRIKFESLFQKK